ncbi:MAG: hypothetical protein JHC33_07770 [Ignisphaera sp.]|nr:hypothetical protein [Ignisphaera sp.]
MRLINALFDDVMTCLYSIDGSENDEECVSQALHALYLIASHMGVKIRQSTLESLILYVRSWRDLGEDEKDLIIDLFEDVISGYMKLDYVRVREVSKRILKMLLGYVADVTSHTDALELTFNAFYASVSLSVLDVRHEEGVAQIAEIGAVAIPTA